MTSRAETVYHLLPRQFRSVAATARGYQLRRWRYGAETDSLADEAIARDYWTAAQWTEWRRRRLEQVLRRAAVEAPYYRELWRQRADAARHDRNPSAPYEQLEQWSVLEKKSVALGPERFLVDGVDRRRMFRTSTSGTTGTPLTLWHSRAALRAWYALSEARWRRWYGVSRHDRWAILGGQMVVAARHRRPPFWVWNAAFKQLYMSSYHLAPDLTAHYLEALQRYKIVYLLGYTSALYALAQHALQLGRSDLRMKVALTNAEPLYDYQRQAIGRAFQCPVRETYGMSEKVAAASECEHGRLHLWPEAGVVEVIDQGQPVAPGEPGDLVATGLLADEMPLIRYRCGDRITLGADDGRRCECGRTLPVIERIEGRVDDVLYTADGRQVGRLDPVFKLDLPIEEAQIIQESLRGVRVLYVPTAGFNVAHKQRIVEELQARMGPIEVKLEEVREVPRTSNGKFRAVVCRVAPQDTATFKPATRSLPVLD